LNGWFREKQRLSLGGKKRSELTANRLRVGWAGTANIRRWTRIIRSISGSAVEKKRTFLKAVFQPIERRISAAKLTSHFLATIRQKQVDRNQEKPRDT